MLCNTCKTKPMTNLPQKRTAKSSTHGQILDAIYQSHQNYLAKASAPPAPLNFEEILSFFFCAGPFYYYILDSPTLTFERTSKSLQTLMGMDYQGQRLEAFLDRVHPDDMDFMLRCEDFVAEFLTTKVAAANIVKYKISYCLRERVRDGSYRLFLMQSITLSATEDGALLKVLGVHTDISHITTQNNYKISLIGMDGEPSYLGLDINERSSGNFWKTENLLSKSELRVIQLLADGLTAKEIGARLFVTAETIITHKKNAMQKTGCKNSNQLVAWCIRKGLI